MTASLRILETTHQHAARTDTCWLKHSSRRVHITCTHHGRNVGARGEGGLSYSAATFNAPSMLAV